MDEFKAWIDCHPDWWVIVLKNYGGGRKVFRCFKAYSRFDRVYVRRILKRFNFLEILAENHHFVHIVFTVRHEGSRDECCRKLVRNWDLFRRLVVKRIGDFEYVRVLEPHRDGYPHMHVLIFTKHYIIDQKCLSEWCKMHGLGKIVFIKRYWAGRYYKRMPIDYLSKYLSKQFRRSEWSEGDLIFYAILWKYRIRSYGFSKNFAVRKTKNEAKIWVKYAVCSYESMIQIIRFHVKNGLWISENCLDQYIWFF